MSASAPTLTTSPRAQLRRALDDAVAGLQAGRAVLLLALDLDDFRRYNAEHGYEAGGALLERFAARLAGVEGVVVAGRRRVRARPRGHARGAVAPRRGRAVGARPGLW